MTHLRCLLGFCIATVALGPALVGLSGLPGGPDGPVLVIVPPWRDAGAVIAASGGWPVGLGDAPMATLAALPRGTAPSVLLREGAWAVLDGTVVASLCGVAR